jgi:hypothetical protein
MIHGLFYHRPVIFVFDISACKILQKEVIGSLPEACVFEIHPDRMMINTIES